MSISDKTNITKEFMKIQFIWSAILSSVGIYLIVCLVIGNPLAPFSSDMFTETVFKYLFFGLSALVFLAVHYIRKHLITRAYHQGILPGSGSIQESVVKQYLMMTIMTSALIGSIAIYGLILFLLFRDLLSLYQLLAIATFGLIYYRPKRNELEALSEAITQKESR